MTEVNQWQLAIVKVKDQASVRAGQAMNKKQPPPRKDPANRAVPNTPQVLKKPGRHTVEHPVNRPIAGTTSAVTNLAIRDAEPSQSHRPQGQRPHSRLIEASQLTPEHGQQARQQPTIKESYSKKGKCRTMDGKEADKP